VPYQITHGQYIQSLREVLNFMRTVLGRITTPWYDDGDDVELSTTWVEMAKTMNRKKNVSIKLKV
jgi:hypothetical protein